MSFDIRGTHVTPREAHSDGYDAFSTHDSFFLSWGTRRFSFSDRRR